LQSEHFLLRELLADFSTCVAAAPDEAHPAGARARHLPQAAGTVSLLGLACCLHVSIAMLVHYTILDNFSSMHDRTAFQHDRCPCRSSWLKPSGSQEEERERRMDFVPDESAVNTELIEVHTSWSSGMLFCGLPQVIFDVRHRGTASALGQQSSWDGQTRLLS